MTNTRQTSSGFTLMEILIAMAILGIIAGVGFSAYTISLTKTHDSTRKNDLSAMTKALEAYQSDFGVYPASVSDRIAGCGNDDPDDEIDGTEVCTWGAPFKLDTGKLYLKILPRDQRDTFFTHIRPRPTSANTRSLPILITTMTPRSTRP